MQRVAGNKVIDNNRSEGFHILSIKCKFNYYKGLSEYHILGLSDIKREIRYFKNTDSYIKSIIDYIKHNVIKHFKNLNSIQVSLHIFDKNNIIHTMMIKIANMLKKLSKYDDYKSFYKTVIVCVEYENNIVFLGGIDFTGLD